MVAVPGATLVTATLTLVALAAKVTVEGTVATPVLLELKLIVKPPAGAGADRFKVRFWVAMPVRVRLAGEKLALAATCTLWLADVYPGAEAVMFADPKFTPLTCGCVAGVVWPPAILTVAGDTVTFVVSLLLSVTVTPPVGAGAGRLIVNAVERFGPTVTLEGRTMVPALTTVTLAVVSAIFGSALA